MRTGIAAVLLALLGIAISAQEPAGTAGRTLVLPAKLAAGERATLAVLDGEGKLASGVTVEFFGGATVVTDSTGRAAFTAPGEPGVITVRLADGTSATSTVLPAAGHPAGELVVDDVPTMVALGSHFRVGGYGFRGDADANAVTLGAHAAVVLAASPMELLLIPGPEAEPGPVEIRIDVGGRQTEPLTLTLVGLEISAEKPQLAPKEKSKLTVRARGTLQRLELEARNLTPDVVRLREGKVQRLVTSGGGENIATLDLEGRRQGEFSVSVRLVPRPAGLPDTDASLRHLIHALPLSPNDDLRERVTRQIHRLQHHVQDVSRVRDELERILSENSSGQFGRNVEAAWKALLKR